MHHWATVIKMNGVLPQAVFVDFSYCIYGANTVKFKGQCFWLFSGCICVNIYSYINNYICCSIWSRGKCLYCMSPSKMPLSYLNSSWYSHLVSMNLKSEVKLVLTYMVPIHNKSHLMKINLINMVTTLYVCRVPLRLDLKVSLTVHSQPFRKLVLELKTNIYMPSTVPTVQGRYLNCPRKQA